MNRHDHGVVVLLCALVAVVLVSALLIRGRIPGPQPPAVGMPRSAGQDGISMARTRQVQPYPGALGVEFIAVQPAAAVSGSRVHIWGSCGCGDPGAAAVVASPPEIVRLWLLGVGRRTIVWQRRHVVVNDGRALLGTAAIDAHARWTARLSLPRRIGAGFGVRGTVPLTAGLYAVMVAYPGEDAGPHYYAVSPGEGYITALRIGPRGGSG